MDDNMKICTKCGRPKPLSEFYNKRMGRGGKDSMCKKCKAVVNKSSPNYRQKSLEAARRWRAKNLERERARGRIYDKKRRAEGSIKYDPFKQRARITLQSAVRSGKIKKPKACQDCGWAGKLHGHHEDYSKPLDVVWVCAICHGKRHRTPDEPTRPVKVVREEAKTNKCKMCGHSWVPKTPNNPLTTRCANKNCQSYEWLDGDPNRNLDSEYIEITQAQRNGTRNVVIRWECGHIGCDFTLLPVPSVGNSARVIHGRKQMRIHMKEVHTA